MFLRVLITTPTRDEALALGRALVEARLAASAQVRPLDTVYRWQGAVQAHAEAELALLSTEARWPALVAAVQARHTYTLPQILSQPVEGTPELLAWIAECTR
jgi:periplasmic divalent cation tolerance protein